MTWQNFGSLAAGNQPLSLIDGWGAQIAINVIVKCGAAGSNAITLTPDATNAPAVSVYTTQQHFSFIAAGNSTTAVTIQVGSLAALKAFQQDGTTQLDSGDLVSGREYVFTYIAALDSAAGGFALVTPPFSGATQGTPGRFTNLTVNVATNTTVAVAATFVTMFDGTNYRTAAISATLDFGNVGVVNGTQTAIAIDTWYAVWAISDGSTDGVFASASFTSPTLPAGYTFKALIGAVQTIHASAILYGTHQSNYDSYYIQGLAGGIPSLTTTPGPLAVGTIGTWSATAPTLVSTTVVGNGKYFPTIASVAFLQGQTNYKSAGLGVVQAAPSSAYSGANNGPDGSNGLVWPLHYNTGASFALQQSINLESTAIYVALSGAGAAIHSIGWRNNL